MHKENRTLQEICDEWLEAESLRYQQNTVENTR